MSQIKAKILLIGDAPGWAFDNIIDFVKFNLKSEYDFYYDFTIYNPRIEKKIVSDSGNLKTNSNLNNSYRKQYFYQRIPVIRSVFYKSVKILNKRGIVIRDEEGKKRRVRKDNKYDCVVYLDYYMNSDGDFDHIKADKTIKGIYTDGFPPKGIVHSELTIETFLEKYFKPTDFLLAGSKSIAERYCHSYKNSVFTANMAYDEKIFIPFEERDTSNKNNFIVGWTGNPNRSFKGFYEIVEPAIAELINEGYSILLVSQFSGTLNSLADFWNKVDLAIIVSEADAGPSLFMEASLCGVPSISTKIGMPNEIIQDYKNGVFIERNKESLKHAIIELYENPLLLNSFKQEIRKDYIQKLGIAKQKENWLKMFQEILHDQ